MRLCLLRHVLRHCRRQCRGFRWSTTTAEKLGRQFGRDVIERLLGGVFCPRGGWWVVPCFILIQFMLDIAAAP